jgi:hypothetical protein
MKSGTPINIMLTLDSARRLDRLRADGDVYKLLKPLGVKDCIDVQEPSDAKRSITA